MFLSLPDEILINILQYYLSNVHVNPVTMLLICTKITNLVIKFKYLNFLDKKYYINDIFLKNIYAKYFTLANESEYKNSLYARTNHYFYYSNNVLASWNLVYCDNLNIKYNLSKLENSTNCIIYHDADTDIKNKIASIISCLKNIFFGKSNNLLSSMYTYLTTFVKITRTKIFTIISLQRYQSPVTNSIDETKYMKNVRTYLKYKKPLGYTENICKKCIEASLNQQNKTQIIFCNHQTQMCVKDLILKIEFKRHNAKECKFYQKIISYGIKLFFLVGKEYTHKIINSLVNNLNLHCHNDCFNRVVLDHNDKYCSYILTNIIYNQICKCGAISNRQRKKKYNISWCEYNQIIAENKKYMDKLFLNKSNFKRYRLQAAVENVPKYISTQPIIQLKYQIKT